MRQITSIDNGKHIEGVAWSADATTLAVTSGLGSQLNIFSSDGNLLKTFQMSVMFAGNSLSFLGDSKNIVTSPDHSTAGAAGPALTVWDASSGKILKQISGAAPDDIRHLSHATIFTTSPNGKYIAYIASQIPGDPVILYKTSDWSLGARIPLLKNIAQSLLFLDAKTLLVGTASGEIQLIDIDDIAKGPQPFITAYPSSIVLGVASLAVSPDGRFLASGAGIPIDAYKKDAAAAPVKIWEIAGRKLVAAYKGDFWPVRALSWDRETRNLAATGGDQSIYIFDTINNEQQKICFEDLTSSLRYAPQRDMLAVAHGSTVSLYENH